MHSNDSTSASGDCAASDEAADSNNRPAAENFAGPGDDASMSSSQPRSLAIEASSLGRRFGRNWALAHIDLKIGAGDSLLLVGANGSGKTTLLRLFCGLLRPSAGTLSLFGQPPLQQRFEVRPRITLVSHRTYLYEQLSALEHVHLWLGLAVNAEGGSSAGDDSERARHLLASVSLDARGHDVVGGFSAGMRKRLSLLRTQIEDPDLILLDEPFSALDPAGQDMVIRWLARLREQGKTLVVASHALEQARQLCEDAVVLRTGQIVWRGPAANVEPSLLEAGLSTDGGLA